MFFKFININLFIPGHFRFQNYKGIFSYPFQKLSANLWHGAKPEIFPEVAKYIDNEMNISIATPTQIFLNIFIQSAINRVFNIFSNSLELKIDKSKFPKLVKKLSGAIISIVPCLLTSFILGMPVSSMLMNFILTEAVTITVGLFSRSWQNFFRKNDLIIETKKDGLASYISRIATANFLNISIALIISPINFIQSFKQTFNQSNQKASQVFINYIYINNETSSIRLYPFDKGFTKQLFNFNDTIAWIAGRIVIDFLFYAAHKIGIIKDLRAPFISGIFDNEIKEKATTNTKQKFISKRNPTPSHKDEEKRLMLTPQEKSKLSYGESSDRQTQKDTDTKPRVLNRRWFKTSNNEEPPSEELEKSKTDDRERIVINEMIFYPIACNGSSIKENTWAVIDYDGHDKSVFEEKCQQTSCTTIHPSTHSGNGIKFLKHKILKHKNLIEIKTPEDPRLIGEIHYQGSGFAKLGLLQQVLQAKETLGPEAHLIIFDRYKAKHDNPNTRYVGSNKGVLSGLF